MKHKRFTLASYPRSGNTMVRLMLKSLGVSPLSVYGPERRDLGDPDGLFTELHRLPSEVFNKTISMKTHYVYPPEGYEKSPTVVVVRDGRDALVSTAHYVRTYGGIGSGTPYLETLEEIIRVLNPSHEGSDWTNFHRVWLRRRNTVVVKYEDLVRDGITPLLTALDTLNIDYDGSQPETPEFGFLHEKNPKFFRKGKIGGWREEMPPELEELFWRRHGKMMERLGYER